MLVASASSVSSAATVQAGVQAASSTVISASSTAGTQAEPGPAPASMTLPATVAAAVKGPPLLAPRTGNLYGYSRANSTRAIRHRRMAALYRRLAQLHMEEADDAEGIPSMESYADEVEREEYV